MADDTSTNKFLLWIHASGWVVCLAIAGLAVYLWHDSKVNDAAQMAQLQQTIQATKETIASAQQAIAQRDAALATQNAALEKAQADAKTAQQQAALISTIIKAPQPIVVQSVPPTPGQNPSVGSGNLVIPDADRTDVSEFVTQCQIAHNDVTTLTADITDLKSENAAQKNEIAAQQVEIKKLKGTRLSKFLKAAKYVGIGIGIGVTIGLVH